MDYSELPSDWETALSRTGVALHLPTLYADVDKLFSTHHGSSTVMYPDRHLVFRAYHATPPDALRAVILGQDPYPHRLNVPDPTDPYRSGFADGLAFSASKLTPPESVMRIVWNLWITGELSSPPSDGGLVRWATEEGVLLLNTALTTAGTTSVTGQKNRSASLRIHKSIYKQLILSTLTHVSKSHSQTGAFLLGAHAREFARSLSSLPPERVYSLNHPSRGPWPATSDVQNPFTELNKHLSTPIDWTL